MTGNWGTPSERLARRLAVKDTGCIEWTGGTNDDGYGTITADGKKVRTHRLAWELANGPIPAGLKVLHHCDNPPCCQTEPTEGYPDGHLFLGTQADNVRDMTLKGRGSSQKITHCPQGHVYDNTNTQIGSSGARSCRACARVRCLANYHRDKVLLGTRQGRDPADIQVVCPSGHEYTEANTYVTPSGVRSCRACGRTSAARYQLKLKTLAANAIFEDES